MLKMKASGHFTTNFKQIIESLKIVLLHLFIPMAQEDKILHVFRLQSNDKALVPYSEFVHGLIIIL